ncbi:MAG: orotate phosphoribosyltransferase [Saprospiraceae bacterium]|nr:orotate phosphoribosyltransferase [Saprospiraceae bacterium]
MDSAKWIAQLLLQIKAIKLNAKDPFTWASGIKSPIYCDNRIALSYPYVRNEIKKSLISQASQFTPFDGVAGVATAGIPHGAILADALGLPFIYVRNKAKGHGRQNVIEGEMNPGSNVLVIEDLISTGGSSMEAILSLQDAEFNITGLLAIFTYQLDYSTKKFKSNEIEVHTLTDYTTLISVAQELQYVDYDDLDLLSRWRKSPGSWKPN